MNLPPVVRDYQEWSNKRLKYNPLPDDIDASARSCSNWRNLFYLILNSGHITGLHMSNIYNRSIAPQFEANGTQVEVWECRNQRLTMIHKRNANKEDEGTGMRRRNRERKTHLPETSKCARLRFVSSSVSSMQTLMRTTHMDSAVAGAHRSEYTRNA